MARPGPATAHGHRSQALTPPTGTAVWPCRHSPVPRPALPPPTAPLPGIPNVQLASESPLIRGYVERYTFSTDLSRHFPPISVSRSPSPRPGNAGGPRGVRCIDAAPRRCVGRARRRGVVPRAREGMQKVRSPCGSADLRGTPAWPEFAQWRSAFTRCLVSASSLS